MEFVQFEDLVPASEIPVSSEVFKLFDILLGKCPATKSDDFLEKLKKGGGGVIFDPKIYVADFGNFKQGFLSMKLTQKE